jgi:hypothetical protein
MKIELIRFDAPEDIAHFKKDVYRLSIDGEVDDKSTIYGYEENDLFIYSSETRNKLKQASISELKTNFNSISLKHLEKWCEWSLTLKLVLKKEQPAKVLVNGENIVDDYYIFPILPVFILIEPNINYKEWNKHFSIGEFQTTLGNIVKGQNGIIFFEEDWNYPLQGFGVIVPMHNENEIYANIIALAMEVFKPIYEETINSLSQKVGSDLITTIFDFPLEIKTSCLQYLMYFGQFLADLGINADTSVKEEANKVLFTITPKDGGEALDRIKEALDIFINAPAADFFTKNEYRDKDIAILQWEANVFHLKGQIALTQATLEAKDATITALRISNYQLQEIISSKKQLTDSAKDSEEEKIMGGVISINKYKGKGFSIDFAELVRRLKRKIKRQ